MRTTRWKAALVAGLMLAGAAGTAAAINLSNSPNWTSWYPRVAVDSQGNITVIWLEAFSGESGDIYTTRYTKSTSQWSTPQNLSSSGRCSTDTLMICAIAVDASDRVYAFWSEGNAVKMRTSTAGSWGAADTIATGSGLDGPRIAASSTGDLFLVWWSADGVVFSRSRVNGGWENVRVISASGKRSKFPDIAVGDSQAIACWVEKNGDIYQAVYTLRGRSANASWSSPSRVNTSNLSQQHPVAEYSLGVTPHIVMTPVVDPNRYVQHCPWTGSGFGGGTIISETTMLHYPSLAQRQGTLIACWQTGAYGNGLAVYINTYQGGSWQGGTRVPNSNGCTYVDVAIDGEGKANVVWDGLGEIYFWSGSGSGGETPVNQPPTADFVFSPQTGLAPLTVTFDGSASSDPDGTITAYDWVFGDGTTGNGQTVNHVFQRKGTYSVQLTVVDNGGLSASKVKPITLLGLAAPLNVRWTLHTDESLFMTRTVIDVSWEKNPANDGIAVIAKHRIYRKSSEDDESAFQAVGETDGSTYTWRDVNISSTATYTYAVTVLDAAGHESPLSGGSGDSADERDARDRDVIRRLFGIFRNPR